jgi:transposase
MAVATPKEKKRKAKSLWMQGFSTPEIEERTGIAAGTVCQWLHREKWVRGALDIPEPGETKQVVQVTEDNPIADAISQKALEQVDRILCHVKRLEFKTLNDCKTASSAVAAAYTTARKALGLDGNGDGGNTYRLYLATPPRPLIDIESSALPCPSDPGTGGGGEQPTGEQGVSTPPSSPLTTDTDLGGGI